MRALDLKWLSNHWFILTFVFASGSAMAYQEFQRQKLEGVIDKQKEQSLIQKQTKESLIRMETAQEAIRDQTITLEKKIDMLIELRLKREPLRDD